MENLSFVESKRRNPLDRPRVLFGSGHILDEGGSGAAGASSSQPLSPLSVVPPTAKRVVVADADNQSYLLDQMLDPTPYAESQTLLLLFVAPTWWSKHPSRKVWDQHLAHSSQTTETSWVRVVTSLGDSKDAADVMLTSWALKLNEGLQEEIPIVIVSHDGFASELVLILKANSPVREITLALQFDPLSLGDEVAAGGVAEEASVRDLMVVAAKNASNSAELGCRLVFAASLGKAFKDAFPLGYTTQVLRGLVADALTLGWLEKEVVNNVVRYIITEEGEYGVIHRARMEVTSAAKVLIVLKARGGSVALTDLKLSSGPAGGGGGGGALRRLQVADALKVYDEIRLVGSTLVLDIGDAAAPSSCPSVSGGEEEEEEEEEGESGVFDRVVEEVKRTVYETIVVQGKKRIIVSRLVTKVREALSPDVDLVHQAIDIAVNESALVHSSDSLGRDIITILT